MDTGTTLQFSLPTVDDLNLLTLLFPLPGDRFVVRCSFTLPVLRYGDLIPIRYALLHTVPAILRYVVIRFLILIRCCWNLVIRSQIPLRLLIRYRLIVGVVTLRFPTLRFTLRFYVVHYDGITT